MPRISIDVAQSVCACKLIGHLWMEVTRDCPNVFAVRPRDRSVSNQINQRPCNVNCNASKQVNTIVVDVTIDKISFCQRFLFGLWFVMRGRYPVYSTRPIKSSSSIFGNRYFKYLPGENSSGRILDSFSRLVCSK